MESLSPRQQSILNRIVEAHIDTALPVGSRFITDLYHRLYRDSYSPATVRYEMGLLEQRGYLSHPHTSAGRVPTDLGYRYYVDHSLTAEVVPQVLLEELVEGLTRDSEEMELLADKVSRKLSELTGEVSAVVLSRGSRPGRYRIYVQGSSTMLEKPEFQDLAKFRGLLKAFEEKMEFAAWLTGRSSGPRATVSIGRENDREVFSQCSVVLVRQEMEEGTAATVAVLGPLRMRYGKTMSLVEQMGCIIKQWIEECER